MYICTVDGLLKMLYMILLHQQFKHPGAPKVAPSTSTSNNVHIHVHVHCTTILHYIEQYNNVHVHVQCRTLKQYSTI